MFAKLNTSCKTGSPNSYVIHSTGDCSLSGRVTLRALSAVISLRMVLLGVAWTGLVLAISTPGHAIVLDTFNEQTQTLTNSGSPPFSNYSAGNVTTIGGQREVVAISSTARVNVVPGQWDTTGNRGDVRYGSGDAALPALNMDWSTFDQFEIDIASLSATQGQLQVGIFTGPSNTNFSQQFTLASLSTGTHIVPFSTLTQISLAPTVGQLADVDGFYVRFLGMGASEAMAVTEVRVTNSLAAAAVPEPSTYALGLIGLAGLGLLAWRKVRRLSAE